MRRFLSSPASCVGLAMALIFFVVFPSHVPHLWGMSLAAFFVGVLALGWQFAPPVLIWVVAINMLSVWADIVVLELNESRLAYVELVANQPTAIIYSSFALACLAVGMRVGLGLSGRLLNFPGIRSIGATPAVISYSATRLCIAYFLFLPASAVVTAIGGAVPALSQAAHVFGLMKFVLIYLLSATIFATNRNTQLLLAVILTEIVIGSTGFFSSYKEGFFVVLIALAGSNRGLNIRQASIAVAGTAAMIYLSLVWTAVKQEFRSQVASGDAVKSAQWLADKYLWADVDFAAAAVALLERVGYTKFYAMVLDANTESLQGIYSRALLHIVTPRAFFPDKAILDDSKQTAQAIGWDVSEGTSIGLGYVAQAHIDFGFPGLAVPMIILGALVALIYAYFLTRQGPLQLREAFAVGVLFNALSFAGNIDKQLGGLVIAFLVMAIALRYGGRFLHGWVRHNPQPPRAVLYRP